MLVCFDLDDTLLDQRGAERAAALEFAKIHREHIAAPGEAFVSLWRRTTEHHFQAFLRGECSFQEQRRRRICALICEQVPDDEADRLFDVYLGAYEANWRLFDDVVPCLKALQGLQLGIITNAAQAQQERKLEHLGIAPYFSFVLSAERAGYAKPHPAIFEQAAAQARVKGPLVYVGDNLVLDAQAATVAGWHGIWLRRGKRGSSSFPCTVETLATLPTYLEALGLKV